MVKSFYCAFVIFIFCAAAFGQGVGEPILRKSDGSILLAKVAPNGEDPSEKIIHTIENTQDKLAKDPTAKYAVRICSADVLPVAFANAGGLQLAVRQITLQVDSLRNTLFLEFSESNILLLRNDKKCGLGKNSPPTEYWFVPSDAELPEFVEVRKQSDINIQSLIFNFGEFDEKLLSISAPENAPLSEKYYRLVKDKLVEMLKKDKTSLLLIETSQTVLKQKKKIVPPEADALKLFLIRQGIAEYRIFIKKSGYHYQESNTNTDFYPNVTMIYQK